MTGASFPCAASVVAETKLGHCKRESRGEWTLLALRTRRKDKIPGHCHAERAEPCFAQDV